MMRRIKKWIHSRFPLLCFMDYWIVFYVLLMGGVAIVTAILEIKLN